MIWFINNGVKVAVLPLHEGSSHPERVRIAEDNGVKEWTHYIMWPENPREPNHAWGMGRDFDPDKKEDEHRNKRSVRWYKFNLSSLEIIKESPYSGLQQKFAGMSKA